MLVGENIGKHSFVHLSANKRLNRMNKSQILDFIAFYKTSQVFLIWGCTLFCTYRELQRKCWSYSTGTYNFQAAPENLRPVGLRFQAFWSPTNGKFSNLARLERLFWKAFSPLLSLSHKYQWNWPSTCPYKHMIWQRGRLDRKTGNWGKYSMTCGEHRHV